MLQSQLSIDFQHFQLSSISQLLLANTPQRNRANLRLKGKRTLKATSSRTNLVGFSSPLFFLFLHIPSKFVDLCHRKKVTLSPITNELCVSETRTHL